MDGVWLTGSKDGGYWRCLRWRGRACEWWEHVWLTGSLLLGLGGGGYLDEQELTFGWRVLADGWWVKVLGQGVERLTHL